MPSNTRGKRRRAALGSDGGEDDGSVDDGADAAIAHTGKASAWDAAHAALSADLLPLLSRPEDLLSSLLDDSSQGDSQNQEARRQLLGASRALFRYIERLAKMEESLKEVQRRKRAGEFNADEEEEEMNDESDNEPCTLSGIPALYTGEEGTEVDAETVWGQVDLQTAALVPRLKKLVKKLGKRSGGEGKYGEDDVVRILDAGAVGSEEGSDEGESGDDDQGSAASDLDEGGSNEEADSDEDSDARRVRERMEKAMADMSDDGSLNSDAGDEGLILTDDERKRRLKALTESAGMMEETLEEEGVDLTREEMRDGFFDLHEMEAFADEEEEMLPDEAYGEAHPDDDGGKKNRGATLPHLRDRTGEASESDDGSGSEGEEDEDELARRFEPTTVRRKKYRADDEVEALYGMYDGGENEEFDESDEDEGDASNMTAADLFGRPDKKLIQGYKASRGKKTMGSNGGKKGGAKKGVGMELAYNDDDADSWDDHNFEEEGMDWKAKGGESESEGDQSDEDGEGEEHDEEEEEEEEEEALESNEKLSTHGLQSKKLAEQTLRLEQDMMAEKPWRMLGEAKGTDRATDSLLESTPEFEVAFKPMPILTAEHATNIEEVIKQRIVDEDWDDVVPRELPDIGGRKGGEAPEVSQEKSKLGLGELYEREYLKKTTGFDRDAHEKQTEEDAAKEEMKRLFANLCSQLDALSNYHFAPRPVAEEADVQNREDVPAIAMEEVLPLHVSQSRGAAPEEVFAAGKGRKSVLKGESELDQAERKRVRSAKKAARRKARKQKHADERLISKLQPGLGLNNPYEKRKLREELQMARASGKVVVASEDKGRWDDEAAAGKEYQTSTKFFAKMQEETERQVHGDGDEGGRAKKKRKGLEAGQGGSVYRL
ncbi:hypothetical protein ACHAXT_005318 [Thalassiosira profunda]